MGWSERAVERSIGFGSGPAVGTPWTPPGALITTRAVRAWGVAPVGEQHGLVGEHEGSAERAGKPGRPGEALIGVRQVLVLVLVVMRHVEAVKALRGEFTAEERKMGPAVLRPTLDVKCLSHDFS